MSIIDELREPWSDKFALQPETSEQRCDVAYIQFLRKRAAVKIEDLTKLVEDSNKKNASLIDKSFKTMLEFVFLVIPWIMGVKMASGALLSLLAAIFPPYAWYLFVEHILFKINLL